MSTEVAGKGFPTSWAKSLPAFAELLGPVQNFVVKYRCRLVVRSFVAAFFFSPHYLVYLFILVLIVIFFYPTYQMDILELIPQHVGYFWMEFSPVKALKVVELLFHHLFVGFLLLTVLNAFKLLWFFILAWVYHEFVSI